mgnify:CR=1 FL=1
MFGIDNQYILYFIVLILVGRFVYEMYINKNKKSPYLDIPRDHFQRAEKQIQRAVKYTNRPKYKAFRLDFNNDTMAWGKVRPVYLWNGYFAFQKKVWLISSRYIIARPDDFVIDHSSRSVVFQGSDLDPHGKLCRLIPAKLILPEEHLTEENSWLKFIRSIIIRQAEIDTIIDREWLSEQAMRPKDHVNRIKMDGRREIKRMPEKEQQEGDPDVV